MSIRFEERHTYAMNVPQAEGFEVLHPESCVLRFANGMSVDIGSLCFLVRAAEGRKAHRLHEGRRVVHDSWTEKRQERVRQLIANVSEDLRDTGARAATVRDRYSRFVAFMGWADECGWSSVLDDRVAARAAFHAYVRHLWDRVGRNEMSVNSGARQQFSVLVVMEHLFDVEDLARGINLLRTSRRAKESTSPPDDAVKGRVLALCNALFDGLSPLVLEAAQYPYALLVPEYLNFPGNKQWLFPTHSWFLTAEMEKKRSESSRAAWVYNYREGRLATLEELTSIEGYLANSRVLRVQKLYRARKQLEAANRDPRTPARCVAAIQAMNVFMILFLSQTGMNLAQLTELTWDDAYQVETSNQGFRSVKWRAGGKTVSFELPIAFMPVFKRYLLIRKHLLAGRSCAFLFFTAGSRGTGAPVQMGSSRMDTTYRMLQRLDPGLPAVTSREWRAAKSDWLLRNTDISTTALVLQNSEATVMEAYAEGSETTAMQEMGDFLDGVATTVLQPGSKLSNSVVRAVGKCSKFGDPTTSHPTSPVQPDCGSPEGCLFCDKFKVHADEVDTRKLASCRYCIRAVSPSVGSPERQAQLFSPVISRIDHLLHEIGERDCEMKMRIVREVDEEGELDPFWARKLEMLMELELVA